MKEVARLLQRLIKLFVLWFKGHQTFFLIHPQ